MSPALEAFDPLLLSHVRLGVIAALLSRSQIAFSELKAMLGVTQGNLGLHLRKLEQAGYVAIDKSFVRRKPRTTCRITAAGRKAFLRHVDSLQRIAKNGSD